MAIYGIRVLPTNSKHEWNPFATVIDTAPKLLLLHTAAVGGDTVWSRSTTRVLTDPRAQYQYFVIAPPGGRDSSEASDVD